MQSREKGFFYKFSEGIVRSRRILLAVFAVLIVFSVFSVGWVELEEDFTYYLPDEAEAKQGLLVMSEEFTIFENLRIMVKGVSEDEAQYIKTGLSETEGVYMVTFDASSDDHMHGDKALFDVVLSGEAATQVNKDTIRRIEDFLLPYEHSLFSSYMDINSILAKEMTWVGVIVAIVVLAVLLFTSSTYGEILVLTATFLTAAVVNMGTNFLLGRISMISSTVTVVMQLALSVDYAIIFCNRYKEEHENLPIEEAVAAALAKSIPEISASSLTTIAGLAAMTFMQFRLGADMGIVLIKSIVLSMLTVFLFMPAMLVFCGKLMDRTRHKNFVPKVSFLGKLAYAGRFIIPFVFIALVIVGYIGNGRSKYDYSGHLMENFHKNEVDLAREEVESEFGKNNMIAALVPSGDYEKELQFAEELERCYEVNSVMGLANVEVMDGLRLADRVSYRDVMRIAAVDETVAKAVIAYAAAGEADYRDVTEDLEGYTVPLIDLFLALHDLTESGIPEGLDYEIAPEQTAMIDDLYEQLNVAKEQLQSDRHSCIAIYADLPIQSEETFDFLDRIHSIADRYYPGQTVLLTGDAVSSKDFAGTFESDNRIVSTLSIVLVMIILLFTFKSVGMPILLIFVIQGSIWLNFAIPAFMGDYVFFMCFLIVSAIQMGANIDYAIVISSRYGELRKDGVSPKDAITDSLNLAFPTVITSGTMMVAAGLLIGFMVSQCVIAGMGKYVGTGTAISLLLVNTALPSILILGDGFARATTLRFSHKLFGPDASPRLRRIGAAALALAAILTLVLTPLVLNRSQKNLAAAEEETESLLQRTRELRGIADALEAEAKSLDDTKMDFAEHLLTEQIGEEELEKGREQIEAGAAELADYKALLESGEEQYRSGVEQYEAGLAQYLEGQAALEEGRRQYEEGRTQYEAAKVLLAEGQAEYDAGEAEIEAAKVQLAEGQAEYDAGEARLAAGKAEYAAAQALMEVVRPIYEASAAAYNAYKAAEARLAALEADESVGFLELAALRLEVQAAQFAFENALLGRSWSQLIADYADAQTQLAAAAEEIRAGEEQLAAGKAELDEGYAQLAEAEEKLAAGKAALDDGYAELAEAEAQLRQAEQEIAVGEEQLADGERELEAARAQLEAAREELDDGAQQISDGEEQLRDAEKQLAEGVDTLDQNRKSLEADLSALDSINDKQEKLDAGMEILRGNKALVNKIGYNSTDAEVCSVAEDYFETQLQTMHKEGQLVKLVSILLLASTLAALIGLLLWLIKKYHAAAVFTVLGTLGALSCAISWKMGCSRFGLTGFWLALALAVSGAIMADILARLVKSE